VVELLREAAGRNKGREEGDVQSIRRGWMLRGCELRTTVFAGSREILRTVIFGCELLCWVSRGPLDSVFCDELLYSVVSREFCTTVSTVSSNFLYTTVLAVSLWYFVGCWLAVSKEQSVLDCGFDQGRHRVAEGFGHGGPGYP
jgi:hypothetical protein